MDFILTFALGAVVGHFFGPKIWAGLKTAWEALKPKSK